MYTFPGTLPPSVERVISLIEKRLEKACEQNLFAIHSFDENHRLYFYEGVDADIVIGIICRIIERLILNGSIVFEGHPSVPIHTRLIVRSVKNEMMREYGHMHFFKKDAPVLLKKTLSLFLKKQHALIRPASRDIPHSQHQRIYLPAHASLQ